MERIRFRLKTFLLVCFAISVLGAVIVNRGIQQKQAVRRIQNLGGNAYYDVHMQGNWIAGHLIKVFGPGAKDHFASVTTIDLSDSSVSSADIPNFPRLERLWFDNAKADNWEFLSKFRNLEELDLTGSNIANIESIEKLRKLRYLNLGQTEVRDFEALKSCHSLETLTLPVDVSDQQLSSLVEALPICKIVIGLEKAKETRQGCRSR